MTTLAEIAQAAREHEESFEIQHDANTVWINAIDGSCVGRFSMKFGIDIHRTVTQQLGGQPQCLFCTHEPATWNDWLEFRRQIKRHFNLEVPISLITFKGYRNGKPVR